MYYVVVKLCLNHLDKLFFKFFDGIFHFACNFLGLWRHGCYRNPLLWLLLGPWLLVSRPEYLKRLSPYGLINFAIF